MHLKVRKHTRQTKGFRCITSINTKFMLLCEALTCGDRRCPLYIFSHFRIKVLNFEILYFRGGFSRTTALKWLQSPFGRCLLIKKYFCVVYEFAGGADLSKGY